MDLEDDDNYGEIEGEGWTWKMMTTMGRLRVKGGR